MSHLVAVALLHVKLCSIESSCLGRHEAFFDWQTKHIYQCLREAFATMCRFQEPLFLGFLSLEDGGCQSLRKVDNYLPCVWSHIPEDFIAYQNLCQNFKIPNAKFLILHDIGS